MTAGRRKIAKQAAAVFCVSLLFGVPMTVTYSEETKLVCHLKSAGHIAQGVVSLKRAESSGEGEDTRYITFEFQLPGIAQIERNEVEVPDKIYDSVEKGEIIAVVYDPHNPSISRPEKSLGSLLYPKWLIFAWSIASATILLWRLLGFWLEGQGVIKI